MRSKQRESNTRPLTISISPGETGTVRRGTLFMVPRLCAPAETAESQGVSGPDSIELNTVYALVRDFGWRLVGA